MNPSPRAAVDVIGPAFDRTKDVLFHPYKWSQWWRIALIGMGTAVIGTANGCNMGGLRDLREAANRDPNLAEMMRKVYEYISPAQLAAFLTVLIVGALALALVHVYVNSVARFMMFDAMTTGQAQILAGWNKWHGHGVRLFGFQFALGLFVTVVLSGLGYLFSASAAASRQDPSAVLLGFLAMLGGTWIFSIAMVCIHQISTDFVVPVMALEPVSLREALRRVWGLASASPGDFILYLLMKLVLVMAASLALVIVEIIVLIVPMIVFIVMLVVLAKSMMGNPGAMVVVVGAGIALGLTLVLFLVAMIAAPSYVFFQGYALEFFADRYPRLKAVLHPPAEAPGPAM